MLPYRHRLRKSYPGKKVPAKIVWATAMGHAAVMTWLGWVLLQLAPFYGYPLFFGGPILLGVSLAISMDVSSRRFSGQTASWPSVFKAVLISYGATSALAAILAIEGGVCVLMATPILLPIAIGSAYLARDWPRNPPAVPFALGAWPVMVLAGQRFGVGGTHRAVCETSVVIQAPASEIWPHVLSLDSIEPSSFWLMRMGVAQPVSTRTWEDGRRVCRLTTGEMPEVVTERVEDRVLEFRVLSTPASMRELNPFRTAEPSHLVGNFVVERGRFELEPLPGGATRVTGRSWYRYSLDPGLYWGWWTDSVVHAVHRSVYSEIARRVAR